MIAPRQIPDYSGTLQFVSRPPAPIRTVMFEGVLFYKRSDITRAMDIHANQWGVKCELLYIGYRRECISALTEQQVLEVIAQAKLRGLDVSQFEQWFVNTTYAATHPTKTPEHQNAPSVREPVRQVWWRHPFFNLTKVNK